MAGNLMNLDVLDGREFILEPPKPIRRGCKKKEHKMKFAIGSLVVHKTNKSTVFVVTAFSDKEPPYKYECRTLIGGGPYSRTLPQILSFLCCEDELVLVDEHDH